MTIKFISTFLVAAAFCSCSNVSSALSNQKTVSSDSNSPIETRNITVSNISEIECARGVTVVYTQGASSSVSVSAPKDIADYIWVEAKGSSLYCTVDKEYQITKGLNRVVVNVVSPKIKSFDASTSATIKIGDLDLGDNELKIDATTAATVVIASVKCGGIDCDVSTAGRASLSGINCSGTVDVAASTGARAQCEGVTDKVDFRASTGATIKALNLVAEKGEASASTGADISCRVQYLNQSSSTGGSVSNKR